MPLRGIIKGKEDITDKAEIEKEVCQFYTSLYDGGGVRPDLNPADFNF